MAAGSSAARGDDGGLVVQARFGVGHLVDLQAHIAERTCHSGGETGGLGGVEYVDGRVARGVEKRLLRVVAGWGAAGGFQDFSPRRVWKNLFTSLVLMVTTDSP